MVVKITSISPDETSKSLRRNCIYPKTTNPFSSLEIVSPAPLTVHKTVQFPTAEREPGSDDGSVRLGPNTLYKHITLVFT